MFAIGKIQRSVVYIARVTTEMFRCFDTGYSPQGGSERFDHGSVLGLMVELADRYIIASDQWMACVLQGYFSHPGQ